MKANEAPEKIYFTSNENGTHYYTEGIPSKREYVEYTRTDAFIEKACEYLQINLWRVVNEEPDFRQRFVTDFRKYMEGE